MKFNAVYSLHNGVEVWEDRGLYEWITDVFEAPKVKIRAGSTKDIREHVKHELSSEGWAFNVRIDPESDLKMFAKKSDLAIQLQTGNISRYAYDLLKIEYLYSKREIEGAALAVPTKESAGVLGSNVVNGERVWNELTIFDRVITVPLMVITFK